MPGEDAQPGQNPKKRPQYNVAQLTAIWKKATGETADAHAEYAPCRNPVVEVGRRNIAKDKEFAKIWDARQQGARDVVARIQKSTSVEDFLEKKG